MRNSKPSGAAFVAFVLGTLFVEPIGAKAWGDDSALARELAPALVDAKQRIETADFAGALVVCDRLTAAYPPFLPGHILRATALGCLGRYEEARREYDLILAVDPKNIVAHLNKSSDYNSTCEYEEALKSLEEVLRVDGDCHLAYSSRAVSYLGLNRDERAIDELDKALELVEPAHTLVRSSYHFLRAEARMRIGRFFLAKQDFDAAIALAPKRLEFYSCRGELLDRVGRHDEATSDYRTAIRLGPSMDLVAPAYDRKTEMFESVSSIRNLSDNYAYLGLCYDRIGDVRSSIRALDLAVKIDPNNESAFERRAASRFARGEIAAARADCVAARRLDRRSAVVVLLLAELDALQNPQAAINSANAFIDLRSWNDPDSPTAAMIGALGAVKSGSGARADALLEVALKRIHQTEWPYPVLKYLHRDISAQELVEAAAGNPDHECDAHAYIGLDLSFRGKMAAHLPHLRRVLNYGNSRSMSYDMAINELRRIDGPKAVANALEAAAKNKKKAPIRPGNGVPDKP